MRSKSPTSGVRQAWSCLQREQAGISTTSDCRGDAIASTLRSRDWWCRAVSRRFGCSPIFPPCGMKGLPSNPRGARTAMHPIHTTEPSPSPTAKRAARPGPPALTSPQEQRSQWHVTMSVPPAGGRMQRSPLQRIVHNGAATRRQPFNIAAVNIFPVLSRSHECAGPCLLS